MRIYIKDLLNTPDVMFSEKALPFIDIINETLYKDGYLNFYVLPNTLINESFIFLNEDTSKNKFNEKNFVWAISNLYNYDKTLIRLSFLSHHFGDYNKIENFATNIELTNIADLNNIVLEAGETIDLYPINEPKYLYTLKYYPTKELAQAKGEPIFEETIYSNEIYNNNHLELFELYSIPLYSINKTINSIYPIKFTRWCSTSFSYHFLLGTPIQMGLNNNTAYLYPLYEEKNNYYDVRIIFDTNGGEALGTQSARPQKTEFYSIAGETYLNNAPSNVFRHGYQFEGWYKDVELTQKILFTDKIQVSDPKTIILYAKWVPNTINIKFNGMPQKNKSVIIGETYGSLPTPTKTGYKFLGWYFQGEKITSNTIVTQADEHQLEPRWEKLEINCTFQLESEVLETKTYSYNETFGALPTSTIDGKEIVWFLEGHPITPDMIVSDLRTEDFTLNGVIGNKVIKMSNKDVVRYMDDDAIIEAMSNIIDPNDKKIHTCINNYLEISYFFPRLKASEQITYYSSNIAGTHVIEVNPRYFDYQIIYPYGNDYYANKDIIITLITEYNKEYTFSYSKATESSIKTMQKDSEIEWLEDGKYYQSSIYASSIRKIIFEIPESPYYEGFYQPFEIKMNSNFSASNGYRPAGLYDSEFNNIEFSLREENEIGTIVIDNEERAIPFIQKAWASEPYLRTYAEIDNQDFATGKLTSGEQGSGVGYARIEAYGKEFEGRLYNCEWDENGIRGTISYPYYIDKYTNEVFDSCSGYLDFDIAWDDESKYYETNHFDIKELEIRY